ncbi:6-phosphogluconate dehydrogenase [Aspergillus unguis]
MAEDTPVIGILSIGEMGLGVANLLIDKGYRVVTFAEDRSDRTRERAKAAQIQLSPSIQDFVSSSSVILSIVPPKDSLATAQRIHENTSDTRPQPLYFLDLNATAPALARSTNNLLSSNPNIVYLDGGIIGGPPKKTSTPQDTDSATPEDKYSWTLPSIVVSGPSLPEQYNPLSNVLNIDHVSATIGAASGLKMCFASLTKGFFALAIQSFVTAESMQVFPELRKYMEKHNPQTLQIADRGLVGMPPKAWRWVNEMQQIGETFEDEGGFSRGLFDGVAEVYRVVAEDTDLGLEQTGQRARGTSVDDVVSVMREGMRRKKEKTE